MKGCERNTEPASSTTCPGEYVPCGKPVAWIMQDDRRGTDWGACEQHAREALLDGVDGDEIEPTTRDEYEADRYVHGDEQ